MQQVHPEILALGAEVFFIGPETRESAIAMMEKQNTTIPLLYDVDGSVMQSYGLSFEIPEYLQPFMRAIGLPEANPKTEWELPIPATYVLDQEGIVRRRHLDPDYTYRMEPADILGSLKEIEGNAK